MEFDFPSGALQEKMRELAKRNLDRVTSTNHVHVGIYRKTGGDHVVIAACFTEIPLLLLYISDKLLTTPTPESEWNWQCGKNSILSAISRLNRESAAGIHELYEFSEGVIYAFKQCVLLSSEPTDLLFCSLIDRGIREFDIGIEILSGEC